MSAILLAVSPKVIELMVVDIKRGVLLSISGMLPVVSMMRMPVEYCKHC